MSTDIKIYRLGSFSCSSSIKEKYFKDMDVIDITPHNDTFVLNYLEQICDNNDHLTFYKTTVSEHKVLLLACLILYYLGGIVINDKLEICNIDVFKDLDLLCVKSCLYDNLFTGLLYSSKNNNVILKSINDFINELYDSVDTLRLKQIEKQGNYILSAMISNS